MLRGCTVKRLLPRFLSLFFPDPSGLAMPFFRSVIFKYFVLGVLGLAFTGVAQFFAFRLAADVEHDAKIINLLGSTRARLYKISFLCMHHREEVEVHDHEVIALEIKREM
ncbi:MAG: hypothetical protein OEV64_15620, partial [Desulfobulbaceae bacterium]|nr:hypothetical protein [Desulfobulbaceae bacterium]